VIDIGWRLADWAITALVGILVYLFQQHTKRVERLEEETHRSIRELEVALNLFTASAAANKERVALLEKQSDAIFAILRRIEDKLDSKMDKP
jgi:polyhydroxyalkanoate synthesis regulator phasin